MTRTWLVRITRIGYSTALVIILLASVVSVTKLLTPILNEHKPDFERYASHLLSMPVTIQDVRIDWNGMHPEIALNALRVLDAKSMQPKLAIEQLNIQLNLWQSLLKRKPVLFNLDVRGVQLTVKQQASGLVDVGKLAALNIHDTATGGSVQTDAMLAWIFSQPMLSIHDMDIRYQIEKQGAWYITLSAISLSNTTSTHILKGKAVLHQDMPTEVQIRLKWEGDVKQLENAQGSFYVALNGLSLDQWFANMNYQNVSVQDGLASLRLWGQWEHGSLLSMHGNVECYDLDLYSKIQKSHYIIDRISGDLKWQQAGGFHTISADNILIDLPNHIWPKTNFLVKYQVSKDHAIAWQDLESGYIGLSDLVDIMKFKAEVLPPNVLKQWIAWNPQGAIKSFAVHIPAPNDPNTQVTYKASFSDLSFSAPGVLPSVQHASGNFVWDGAHGRFDLQSQGLYLTYAKMMPKPLYFTDAKGLLTWQQDQNQNWLLHLDNLVLKNADLEATMRMDLIMPPSDSPRIDFTSQFHIEHVENITEYLPLPIFDPDLQTWLKHAFTHGEASEGSVILQGRLADFPFDHGTGKFFIGLHVKHIDLLFAPKWPQIHDLDARLGFAGRSIVIDVASGNLLDIPIGKVHAVIPYLGDAAPQMLNVKTGDIQLDLQKGLELVHKSPLNDGLGKDLAGMDLNGPMTLNLDLTVPLKHPDGTTVIGEIQLLQGRLSLPAWNLSLDNMRGPLQFTDNTLESKGITGTLFDTPLTLTMTTIPGKDKTHKIQASFASVLTIPQLETWLKVRLSPWVSGALNYQANLQLASHSSLQPSTLTLTSDLKQVAVNLPPPYGKVLTDTKPLQYTLQFDSSTQIKSWLDYAHLVNAAFTLQPDAKGLHFYSGELRLGGTTAALQTLPGWIISGHLPVFNSDTWMPVYTQALSKDTAQSMDIATLREVHLDITTSKIFGVRLTNLDFDAVPRADAVSMTVKSNELSGVIRMPWKWNSSPIVADLQYLNISSDHSGGNTALDPKKIPSLQLNCKDLRFGDMTLGNVRFNLQSKLNGLTIKQVVLEKPSYRIEASGDWSGNNVSSSTRLQGTASTTNLSNALKDWGFASNNFAGSTADARFDLRWPAAPYQPMLTGLNGSAELNLGKGSIQGLSQSNDAKMGLGRLLTIFSLSTLPRRLSLDFSDLFGKGYSFDNMRANFKLQDGSAYTDDMAFNGPVAHLGLTGRVGLKVKDIDLNLNVTPHVTSSLPVVATIAGGPVAGVAAWMVDKVISHAVSKVTTYHYRVTGSWDNPSWQELGKSS